jgi:hypothetical protein
MTPEASDALVATLTDAIAPALPELTADGWQLESIKTRSLMMSHFPVVGFRRGDHTLGFIVSPTDPAAPAFKRSKRYDLTYFSEDVADNQQGLIYQRDRAFIERVAAWLRRWDP